MADILTTRSNLPEPGIGRIALVHGLARGWWLFLLRGAVAILFGVIALASPVLGLAALLGFLGAWMLVEGVFTIWQAIAGPTERHGLWFWLDGIVSLLAAAAIFLAPGLSSLALVIVAGAWWAATGVFEIVAGFRRESWLLGLAGLASLVLGLAVLALPGPGLLALVWLVAIQALVFGGLLISLGLRLRRVAQDDVADAARAGTTSAASDAGRAPLRPGAATSPATAPGATSAIAPTAVPAVDTDETPPRPANDPERRGGRGAA